MTTDADDSNNSTGTDTQAPGPDDLNALQRDMLFVLANGPRSGAEVKRTIEAQYRSPPTGPTIYNNLDTLVELGLAYCDEKALDRRTNEYGITRVGVDVAFGIHEWYGGLVGLIPVIPEDVPDALATDKPATEAIDDHHTGPKSKSWGLGR